MIAAGDSSPGQIRDARHYLRSIARVDFRAADVHRIQHEGNLTTLAARERATRPHGFAPHATLHGHSDWVLRQN
eukprot:4282992-Alexandrium_andersonii.AAC.1